MKKSKGDEFGYKRGAVGYGQLDKTDREFLKPDFDRETNQGPMAPGMYPKVKND